MFHYLGNERLQLYFFSPNVCAAFLVMSVLLSIGFLGVLVNQKKLGWKFAGWGLFFPVIFLQFIMLAITYSRGGYIACFLALLTACFFSRKKWSFLFPVLFTCILLMTGDAGARVKSIGNVGDGSIQNRLLLWEGGTGIIADHWFWGLHNLQEVGLLYTRHYQPLWLKEGYLTLISDYLTVAAQYGIFTLFLILTFLFFLLQQGAILYKKEHNPLLLYACAAVSGYMVASFFSTCYRFINVTWLFGVAILIIVLFVGRATLRHRMNWTHWNFWPAPILAATVCIVILSYGIWVNASLPYSWEYGTIFPKSNTVRTLTFCPRKKGNEFHILLLTPKLENAIRPVLRPLVLAGFTVTALEIEPGFHVLDLAEAAIEKLIATPNSKRFILFSSEEEQVIQTLAVATQIQSPAIEAVAVVDAPFDWPFAELSPRLNIMKCQYPLFLLFHTNRSEENRALGKIAQVHLEVIPASVDRWVTDEEVMGKHLRQLLQRKLDHADR